MRVRVWAIVTTMCVVGAGAIGAPTAAAAVRLPAAGGAIGSEGLILNNPGGESTGWNWQSNGGYVTDGQLGKGEYRFTGTARSDCGGTLSGTAKLTRSDGATLTGHVSGTMPCAENEQGTEQLTLDLTTGTRDLNSAHLVFGGNRSHQVAFHGFAWNYYNAFQIQGDVTVTTRIGYSMTDMRGHVTSFGGAPALGDAPTVSATRIAFTPSQNGYWIVDTAGHVFAYGDAHWYGNAVMLAVGETVRSIASTPTNHGYWLFTSVGRVLTFGDATFHGDMHTKHLNGAIVDATASVTGRGYYLVGTDGGVFAFGDAHFYGSTANLRLNQPVNGVAPTPTGHGYCLTASDGGVFAFGDARFRGSMGAQHLNQPVVGIDRYGNGYLLIASDGGIFNFSNQPFYGSLGGISTNNPIVATTSTG